MIKIFADGADLKTILELNKNPLISGFTTNPSLMPKAVVEDYEKFAREVLAKIKDKPVSFEVLSDDFNEMKRQARKIASWGDNVYVKIPITDTKGKSSIDLIHKLLLNDIKLNITAITKDEQVLDISFNKTTPIIVSIFAGRIADTGINPISHIEKVKDVVSWNNENIEILWASSREVLNIYQAEEAGVDIITCTPELIAKYEKLKGKDLTEYSLETVQMFFRDGQKVGYKL